MRKLFRHHGLGINLLAGLSFLVLAVYGWGLDWGTIIDYLVAIAEVMFTIIIVAALAGWILRKWRRLRGDGKN